MSEEEAVNSAPLEGNSVSVGNNRVRAVSVFIVVGYKS